MAWRLAPHPKFAIGLLASPVRIIHVYLVFSSGQALKLFPHCETDSPSTIPVESRYSQRVRFLFSALVGLIALHGLRASLCLTLGSFFTLFYLLPSRDIQKGHGRKEKTTDESPSGRIGWREQSRNSSRELNTSLHPRSHPDTYQVAPHGASWTFSGLSRLERQPCQVECAG